MTWNDIAIRSQAISFQVWRHAGQHLPSAAVTTERYAITSSLRKAAGAEKS
jgi:hypothetical protein